MSMLNYDYGYVTEHSVKFMVEKTLWLCDALAVYRERQVKQC